MAHPLRLDIDIAGSNCYPDPGMIHWPRLLILIPLSVVGAHAQMQLHVGIDAGVPITDTLPSYSSTSVNGADYSFSRFNSVTKRLLIGPSLRLDLPKGLGLEFDALYQRVNYDSTNISSVPAISYYDSFEPVRANRWQFPLLIQYSRRVMRAKFFVEAGPAISTIVNSRATLRTTSTFSVLTSTTSTTTTNSAISGQSVTFAGITTGVGADIPVLHGHLRPEFRYSHWFSPNSAVGTVGFTGVLTGFSTFLLGPISTPSFQVNRDEASFLLGLSF
ncbi:MAG TPA: outer membrane beta-barrel protein [Bryobacteraceae bacterium]|nr:outer membrane beta-barrel protein [Bryobacteraceae bacterium]